ncbi:PREDICTED: toxin MIT1-like [Branchiostoma belcheri]|uniref:Toxin MIT1-like n=1 Tax=Branchiostoma belcheri TaxID=7741 RepID=A0A6P4ZH18_BRABE|nr:PREDICTED: toxin MIT1-like [Branchiostoma belcheri]
MKTFLLQLSMVCAAAVFRVASPLVITGGCRSDYECIANKGENWCCARWNLGSGIAVCKPRGRMDDECHISSNLMPYPLDAPRAFWRCPCGPDLGCTATETAKIGHCTTFDNLPMKRGMDME